MHRSLSSWISIGVAPKQHTSLNIHSGASAANMTSATAHRMTSSLQSNRVFAELSQCLCSSLFFSLFPHREHWLHCRKAHIRPYKVCLFIVSLLLVRKFVRQSRALNDFLFVCRSAPPSLSRRLSASSASLRAPSRRYRRARSICAVTRFFFPVASSLPLRFFSIPTWRRCFRQWLPFWLCLWNFAESFFFVPPRQDRKWNVPFFICIWCYSIYTWREMSRKVSVAPPRWRWR